MAHTIGSVTVHGAELARPVIELDNRRVVIEIDAFRAMTGDQEVQITLVIPDHGARERPREVPTIEGGYYEGWDEGR